MALLAGLLAFVPAFARTSSGCVWEVKLDPGVFNTLFPDTHARYWGTVIPAVPGETLTIKGEFPHGRYMSFVSYSEALQSVDGLNDQHIQPDAGSTNPFFTGESRNGADRSYTVTVVQGQRPADAPDNVLYTANTSGDKSGHYFSVLYRVYQPDAGYDVLGGVGLPTVIANLPNGTSAVLPDCPAPASAPDSVNDGFANSGNGGNGTKLAQFPGTDPPKWRKFYNFETSYAYATDNGYTGSTTGDSLVSLTTTLPKGGFADNPDNAYITLVAGSYYGNAIVLHGKLPTFPDTYPGSQTMGAGQLRYWSLCANEGISQRVNACLADYQVVTDSNGFYTIVVTNAANRPSNANAACGVNWLPWGPSSGSVLIMRNMLPDPGFTNSIQSARYDQLSSDLGDYFPVTSYTTASEFASRGCPAG